MVLIEARRFRRCDQESEVILISTSSPIAPVASTFISKFCVVLAQGVKSSPAPSIDEKAEPEPARRAETAKNPVAGHFKNLPATHADRTVKKRGEPDLTPKSSEVIAAPLVSVI
jgi:hypothetical protein